MSFQISALPKAAFQHLFELPRAELASVRAVPVVATTKPGFPCRISLEDAEIGEELILVHHEHQAVDTPYRASHAISVRRHATEAKPSIGETPEMLRSRTLSLRAFDANGMMITADLVGGKSLEPALAAIFQDPLIAYIHIHFAAAGCYAARVDRA